MLIQLVLPRTSVVLFWWPIFKIHHLHLMFGIHIFFLVKPSNLGMFLLISSGMSYHVFAAFFLNHALTSNLFCKISDIIYNINFQNTLKFEHHSTLPPFRTLQLPSFRLFLWPSSWDPLKKRLLLRYLSSTFILNGHFFSATF